MKTINKYIYIILGLLITLFVIWNRLLRIRLPREIPYILNDLSFILLLLYISLLLSTIALIIFKVAFKSNFFVKFFTKSLLMFHNYIVNGYVLTRYIDKSYRHIITLLYNNKKFITHLYFFVKSITLFMAILLNIEIFFLHQIKVFYLLLPILFLPLLFSYLTFTLTNYYQTLLLYLNERLNISYVLQTEENLTFKEFQARAFKMITVQEWITKLSLKELNLIHYGFKTSAYLNEEFYIKQWPLLKRKEALKKIDFKRELSDISSYFEPCKRIFIIIHMLNDIKQKYDKPIILVVLIMYLFAWTYIFMKSIHTLPNNSFSWLQYFVAKYDSPFI